MGAGILGTQFRMLVKKQETMTRGMNVKKLAEASSKELISRFFQAKNGLSNEIELVLRAIAYSSIKYETPVG